MFDPMQVQAEPLWPPETVFAPAGHLFRYRVYGLSVASGLRLDLPEDPAPGAPSVCVEAASQEYFSRRCAGMELEPDDGSWYRHGFLPDGAIYLRWDGLFQFCVAADGRRVMCGSLGAETMESFQVYLLGHSLGFALVNQGEEPLHATVVTMDGRTVALLGRCGSGKSTLAAYLLYEGGRLVTDDLLRLSEAEGRYVAHPGPQRIKLLPEPAGLFMKEAADMVEMNPDSNKFVIPLPESKRCTAPVALDALFLLDWPAADSPGSEARLERLTGREAFLNVIAATFNIRIKTPARLARQFRFAESLCARLPLYRLSYPREFSVLPHVRQLLWEAV